MRGFSLNNNQSGPVLILIKLSHLALNGIFIGLGACGAAGDFESVEEDFVDESFPGLE